jgi:DNA-binding MarR family transcriptional regulator
MSLALFLPLFSEDPAGFAERELAHVAGEALHAGEDTAMRRFRVLLARPIKELDPYRKGLRHGIAEVLAAYDLASARSVGEERAQTAVATKDGWKLVLSELVNQPAGTKEIADKIRKDPAQVSRWLSELAKAVLVESWPVVVGDKRSRPYRMTSLGRDALAQAQARVAEPSRKRDPPTPKTPKDRLEDLYQTLADAKGFGGFRALDSREVARG